MRRVVGVATVCAVGAWGWATVGLAHAASVTVQQPEAFVSRSAGTEYEVPAQATQVILRCAVAASNNGAAEVAVTVDGRSLSKVASWQKGVTSEQVATVTWVEPALTKWEYTGIEVKGCSSSYATIQSAGGEGSEGKEGKEGKPGLEWKGVYSSSVTYELHAAVYYEGSSYISIEAANKGNTPGGSGHWELLAKGGGEGKEGKEGKAGGGSAGGEVTKFGAEATAEIDGDTEVLADAVMALLGVALAAFVVGMLVWQLQGRAHD